ncbi:MAG: lipid-A-disaccharide synthase [Megasphaera sp.]|nr:lipid-A-disaccharide synthase [Megasphaera sp.]MCH4187057.1 lipid-A-disaccharide synthase [Megasphaera sp.]MCH4217007.1 lipid-A-disaccharide synthase [Megasphaera sp.]
MKIMFSAGEASGDLHGAHLAQAFRTLDPSIELIGMGGNCMAKAGVRIIYDIKNLGFIGVGEILRKIPFFFRLRSFLMQTMEREKPDVLICVDYPGFNMRLIKKAKAAGIPVVYYILPTIWAWNKSRGAVIAKYTDLAVSLFPFEADLYRHLGTNVVYAGHPLLDEVHPSMSKSEASCYFGLAKEKPTVLLMPGSRLQEVKGLLPDMLAAAKKIQQVVPEVQFILPKASTIDRALLEQMIQCAGISVTIGEDHVYDMMNISTVAIASSGTATLETALMALPTVLIYRVSKLTYVLAKLLVHVENIGLPNIIMGHRIMPELWEDDVTGDNIANTIIPILTDSEQRQKMSHDMAQVRATMGETGVIDRIATTILQFITKENYA